MNRAKKVRVIAASMAVTSLLYYVTSLRRYPLQEFFTRLYYIPIILGALWFGLWGGVLVSLSITQRPNHRAPRMIGM